MMKARLLCCACVVGMMCCAISAFTAEDLEYLGKIETNHLGRIVTQGQLVYVGEGTGLSILDVSDPSKPARIGRVLVPQQPLDIDIVGQYAYVSNTYNLSIIDISDPTSPSLKASYANGKTIEETAWDGTYLYAAEDSRLEILDLSNPTSLSVVGEISVAADCVAVAGKKAYVAGYDLLTVIDVTDAAKPVVIGRSSAFFKSCANVDVDGDRVFLSFPETRWNGGSLGIFDVSDPTAPVLAKSLPIDGTPFMTIADGRIFVTQTGSYYVFCNPEEPLYALDMGNPADPVLHPLGNITGRPAGIAVIGNRAYATSNAGMFVVDVTDADHVSHLGNYKVMPGILDVAASGRYAYLGTELGLDVVDLDNPREPAHVARCYAGTGAQKVVYSDSHVFFAGGLNGLGIIDVADPTSPSLVGFYNTTNPIVDIPNYVYNVALQGNTACISTDEGGLQIVDVSDLSSPSLKSTFTLWGAADVEIAGNLAYAGLYAFNGAEPGLCVVDITTPTHPVQRSFLETSITLASVAVDGSMVYAGGSDSHSVVIIDAADPDSPKIVGWIPYGGTSLLAKKNLLWGTSWPRNLWFADATNPQAPQEQILPVPETIGELSSARLATRRDLLLLSVDDYPIGGLYVFRSNRLAPEARTENWNLYR